MSWNQEEYEIFPLPTGAPGTTFATPKRVLDIVVRNPAILDSNLELLVILDVNLQSRGIDDQNHHEENVARVSPCPKAENLGCFLEYHSPGVPSPGVRNDFHSPQPRDPDTRKNFRFVRVALHPTAHREKNSRK